MAYRLRGMNWQTPTVGGLGGGIGLTIGEFWAEFFAQVGKQTGWNKFGVKAVTKIVIGTILLAVSKKITPGLWRLAMEVAGYGAFGGIFLDLFTSMKFGGVTAIAETAALRIRRQGIGMGAVTRRFQSVAATPVSVMASPGGSSRFLRT